MTKREMVSTGQLDKMQHVYRPNMWEFKFENIKE